MDDDDTGLPRAVFVVGPESSGSKFIARTIAVALGLDSLKEWDGSGQWPKEHGGGSFVLHRSLPYLLRPPRWPDLDEWVTTYNPSHAVRFVVTTRDRSISELSRQRRFGKPVQQVQEETNRAVRS